MTYRAWSCDSLAVTAPATRNTSTIFAKNSDRPAGEMQAIRHVRAHHITTPLPLAYITIDNAPAFAHIGSAPYWCWGYEFGVNEHHVAIGNEAVFTTAWAQAVHTEHTQPGAHEPGLLGMELVRLGLERGATARQALTVMTDLLERHGQWGSALIAHPHETGSYDNSYLIADPTETWILETVGRGWAAHQVRGDFYALSNELTLRTDYDRQSVGLAAAAPHQQDSAAARPLDFAATFADPHTPLQVSHIRRRRTEDLLNAARAQGPIGIDDVRGVLRDHLETSFLGGPTFDAAQPDFHTLCMHEHPSGFTWGNTAASIIAELPADPATPAPVWWCPATPCTSLYIPLFLHDDAPHAGLQSRINQRATDPRTARAPQFDPQSLWWRLHNVLDAAKDPQAQDFTRRAAHIRARLDTLEATWHHALAHTTLTTPAEQHEFTQNCIADALRSADDILIDFGYDPHTPIDPRWATHART